MNKILTNICVVAATVVSVGASNSDNPVASSSAAPVPGVVNCTSTTQATKNFTFNSFVKHPSYLSIDKEKVSAINSLLNEQNIKNYNDYSSLACQVVRASKLIALNEGNTIHITNSKEVDAICGLLKLGSIYNGDLIDLTNKCTVQDNFVNNATKLMFDALLVNADNLDSTLEVNNVIGKMRSLASLFVQEGGKINNF